MSEKLVPIQNEAGAEETRSVLVTNHIRGTIDFRHTTHFTPETARAMVEVAEKQFSEPERERTKQSREKTKQSEEETKQTVIKTVVPCMVVAGGLIALCLAPKDAREALSWVVAAVVFVFGTPPIIEKLKRQK